MAINCEVRRISDQHTEVTIHPIHIEEYATRFLELLSEADYETHQHPRVKVKDAPIWSFVVRGDATEIHALIDEDRLAFDVSDLKQEG